ncbi:WD repeat-containing protein 89 isoform X2 [Anabrus simplex]|uniref:WD repeat-containing protein 89 isoform X2 n=1 Tax=Anabrus simplex TaxID=316456 RepID=UPI0035A3A729
MDIEDRLFSIDIDNGEVESNDADTCSTSEIESLFNTPYTCVNEVRTPAKTWILHMSGNKDVKPLIAVGLSDFSCSVYDGERLEKICSLCGHKGTISGVRFNSQNGNLLYSGSCDGSVKLWDIRTGNVCVNSYQGTLDTSEKVKPILSFDVTPNDRWICAGTELVNEDAFILFWDARSSKLLGGYWESHTDDITQVKCHPSSNDRIATGSTDGLINIYDIKKSSEEDAFLYCLNTESLDKLGWFSRDGNDALMCITSTHILQLWDPVEVAPDAHFSREAITSAMMRKNTEDCYLVDIHPRESDDGRLVLLCGSRAGKGECLRLVNVHGKKLSPASALKGNKQIVQASWFDEDSECLVTGGERGILNVWKPHHQKSELSPMKLKADSKLKLSGHRVKQY